VVEGPERSDGWFVAVQRHPEATAEQDPARQTLFDAFVEAARQVRTGA